MSELISIIRTFFIAVKYLFKRPFTVKYHPNNDERIAPPERLRGELILNLPKCVGCALCFEACPNGNALEMVPYDNGNPKNKKKQVPQYNVGGCTFCGLCTEACPYGVLRMGKVYDRAYTNYEEMVHTPEELYEEWKRQMGEVVEEA